MAVKSFKIKALVLKKTKLSENDLIISLLAEDGSLHRAVAKGARKPSSTLSARLEICSSVELLLAKGKSLDIVREVKLLNPYTNIRSFIEKLSSCSPILELLDKTSQQGLIEKTLYPLTIAFLDEIVSVKENVILKSLCLAGIIKICSILGFRPNLSNCCVCRKDLTNFFAELKGPVRFSFEEGGIVCFDCSNTISSDSYNSSSISLLHNLIHSKFEDIKYLELKENDLNHGLSLCRKWLLFHLGVQLKSLDFYLNNF